MVQNRFFSKVLALPLWEARPVSTSRPWDALDVMSIFCRYVEDLKQHLFKRLLDDAFATFPKFFVLSAAGERFRKG